MTSSERHATAHFMTNRKWDHHREIAQKMESYPSSIRGNIGMDVHDDQSSDGSESEALYLPGKSSAPSGATVMERYSHSMESENSDHKSSAVLDDQARRYRTNYSRSQISRLEDEFRREKYLSRPRRCELAAELGLKETTIKVWFQNRRMKEKRQMASLALPVFANADPNLYAFLMESASAYLNYTANKSTLPTSAVSGQSDLYNPFTNPTGTPISSSNSLTQFTDHSSPKVNPANILQAPGRFPPVPLTTLPPPHLPPHPLLSSYESNLRHSIDQFRMSAPNHHSPHNTTNNNPLPPFSAAMPYFLHQSLHQNVNCSPLPLPLIKFPNMNAAAENLNKYSSQESQSSSSSNNNNLSSSSLFPTTQKSSPGDCQTGSPKKKLFRPFMQSDDN